MLSTMVPSFRRSRVCVLGSSVAPVLSDIFLSSCDRGIASKLGGDVIRVFRYVHNYLVLFRKKGSIHSRRVFIESMLLVFKSHFCGLNFRRENPVDRCIQFSSEAVYDSLAGFFLCPLTENRRARLTTVRAHYHLSFGLVGTMISH